MTKGRLEAFSDGVIAIIITITILLIDLPEGSEWRDLAAIMPIAGSYLISFFIVGTNWVNHHHLLQAAGEVNGRILWANLIYLFTLSFIPLSTGWVGRSMFAPAPVSTYVIVNLAIAGSYLLLERMIIRSADSDILRAAVNEHRKELGTIGIEALALVLSLIPGLHYAACPLLAAAYALWIIPDLRMKRAFEEAGRDGT